jgi:CubicO group peptidase (beta-lactamase class C family)
MNIETKLAEVKRFIDRTDQQEKAIRNEIKRKLNYYLPKEGPNGGKIGPGIAVLVYVNGKCVLKESYGNARISEPCENGSVGGQDEKITEKTVFDLASLSKHFTALGILLLIDQTTLHTGYQKLSFRTKLRTIIPELPSWADKITIRHLLNHRSGLQEYFNLQFPEKDDCQLQQYFDGLCKEKGHWYATMEGYETAKKRGGYITNENVLDLLATAPEPLISPPGKEFSYSNTGYVLLAEIIRRVTGKSLRLFLKDEIFDRLGMTDTFVYDETVPQYTGHALCYRLPDGACESYSGSIKSDTIFNYIHGDGNVHSTLRDLEKWILAWNKIDNSHIKDPEPNVPDRNPSDKLIKRTTFLAVYRYGIEREKGRNYYAPWDRYKYSSGMQIYRYKNQHVNSYAIHHGGNWLGFNSYLMRGHVQLEQRHRRQDVCELTILVLSNYFTDWGTVIFPLEIGRMIAEKFWPWKKKERYNVLQYI